MFVCVCVCVCARARARVCSSRESAREREREREVARGSERGREGGREGGAGSLHPRGWKEEENMCLSLLFTEDFNADKSHHNNHCLFWCEP